MRRWLASTDLPHGVSVRVGRWEVPGRPIAILVKFDGLYADKNEFYGRMWQQYGVDSLHAYGDYDEACAFARAAGMVIESIVKYNLTVNPESSRIIAHFDEWTTGMGLLYVKSVLPTIATVFTTHATSIGRSICGNGKNLYQYFHNYNGDQMARELNMEAKHSLEKAAAHNADCFTTVSDITADECEQLLQKRPDTVTPNGFEENFVPEKSTTKERNRRSARKKLVEVANALTGADLNADNTFIVATSGRCEYRNKGLDVFIDSINTLGNIDPGQRVLAFIMVPAWVKAPRADLALNLSLNKSTPLPSPTHTHTLFNPDDDAVVNHIDRLAFTNKKDCKTFLIYVPCYLNGDDGIFDKKYYDLLIGMDATVFPSYYEPWGYTPLESIAFGVPTITTALSGFGRWVLSNFPENDVENTGVYVTPRNDSNYPQTCSDIAKTLKKIIATQPSRRQSISLAAMATAHAAAWSYFIDYYINAYTIALNNAENRR